MTSFRAQIARLFRRRDLSRRWADGAQHQPIGQAHIDGLDIALQQLVRPNHIKARLLLDEKAFLSTYLFVDFGFLLNFAK